MLVRLLDRCVTIEHIRVVAMARRPFLNQRLGCTFVLKSSFSILTSIANPSRSKFTLIGGGGEGQNLIPENRIVGESFWAYPAIAAPVPRTVKFKLLNLMHRFP